MTVEIEKFYIIKPQAATNLCTNPSFETNTTGWATGGTNTLALSSAAQSHGVYSCKITYGNNSLYSSYSITLTAAAYVAAVDIYIPTAYDGTELTLTWTGYVGASVTAGLANMTIRDKWQRVHCHITPVAGDLAGTLTLHETGAAATAARFIYIDGVQIETGASATTFIDGDNLESIRNRRQYGWTGSPHASTSFRLATTRSGGLPVDITNYCKKVDVVGLGIAPADINSISLTDGTERYRGTNLNSRYFTIAVTFGGNSDEIGDVQGDRNALTNLIKPDLIPYDRPLHMLYQALDASGGLASEPVDIECVYVGGLDIANQRRFERANLVFKMPGSYMQRSADSASVLGYQTTVANMKNIMQRSADGVWSAVGSGVTGGGVTAMAIHPITGDLYIGGSFTAAGGVANTTKIARWDGTTFSAVGGGLGNSVLALEFAPNGDLYIGGAFLNAGGVAEADHICRWDGSAYSAVGDTWNNSVASLLFASDGDLYIGGYFTTAAGVANANCIAKWDGTNITAVGAGLNGGVLAIAEAPNGEIYLGGIFTDAGSVTEADKICKWNGTTYSALGNGLNNYPYALAFASNGDLYIAGTFTDAGGNTSADYICMWDGLTYRNLGKGLSDAVLTLEIDQSGNVYAGGVFVGSGDLTFPDRMAIWTGSFYTPLDINVQDGSAYIYSIKINKRTGTLYVGGNWAGTNAISATVTTPGISTATSYPIIKITGPGTIWQIKNYTTGKAIYFDDLTLLAGEVITLDLRPGQITMTSSWRGSILPYVLKGSSYDFPLMPGSNNISAYLFGATTAASGIVMTWKDNYHSIDGAQYA